jgi:hypothetical protein
MAIRIGQDPFSINVATDGVHSVHIAGNTFFCKNSIVDGDIIYMYP